MPRDGPEQPTPPSKQQPYSAEKARGGEIILNTPVKRWIFIAALAGGEGGDYRSAACLFRFKMMPTGQIRSAPHITMEGAINTRSVQLIADLTELFVAAPDLAQ
jgi:hypothetical protein